MKPSRYLLARVAWTVFAAWLVLSGTFFVFAYTPDPNESLVKFAAGYQAALGDGNVTEAQQEAVEAYRSARNYDEPLLQRYTRWVTAYATFDWGVSYTYGKPVNDVIVDRAKVTLTYLVPAALLAILLGTLVGLVSATREHSVLDFLGRSTSYLGLGVPNFWLASVLVLVGIQYFDVFALSKYDPSASPTSPGNLPLVVVAGVVVGVNLLAIQVRYARSETREYLPQDFVKTLRSTGASGTSVLRHVLRNASIPLVSLLFTEVLIAAMIDVFVVEAVLELPGLGFAGLEAIRNRDIGLVLGIWMLPMFVALGGSLLQDVLYTVLDPRVGDEE